MALFSNANLVRFSRRLFYVGGAIAISLLLTITIYFLTGLGRAELKSGEVAPDTLRSSKTIVYKSNVKTKEAREEQSSKVAPVYLDKTVFTHEQQSRVDSFTSSVDQIRSSSDSQSQKVQRLRDLKSVGLSADTSAEILALSETQWQNFQDVLSKALSQLQTQDIPSPIPQTAYNSLNAQVDQLSQGALSAAAVSAIKDSAHSLLIANKIIDQTQTNTQKQQAQDQVGPVLISIERGEVLTLKGQLIDQFALEKLEAVGLAKPSFSSSDLAGIFALTLSIVGVISLYFHHFIRDVRRRKQYLLIGVVLLVVSIGAILLLPVKPTAAYAFPVPAVGVLLALIVDLETGILCAVAASILVGYLAGESYEIAVIQLIASIVGILLSRSVSRLNSFALVGLGVMVAVFIPALGFLLISGDFSLRLLSGLAAGAFVNGVISTLLVIGAAIVVSRFFGFVSFIQLMELENPSHPLLRQLVLKAPGTYQHSLVIANMAERAAQAIGANGLLIRVGAYYHDIGKINNPTWFTENQHGVNPHDKLADPLESAKRIIAHVTDGAKLAQQHHMPEEIAHFILSHHGTTKIEYFWHLAKRADPTASQEDFTYPGPRPQTKEAAIMMLADGIEARARSLTTADEQSLQETIDYIVEQRKEQRQLEESGITGQDIEQLKEAFLSVLTSVYQHRIKYPGQK